MIGSKRKTISVVQELEKEGIPREAFEQDLRAHGPGDRRRDAGRDRHFGGGGDDRGAPRAGYRLAAAFEIDFRARPAEGPVEVIAGIILAAGASSRMGTPKALLDYRGETFVGRLIRVLGACCHPVIVVLGYHADAIRQQVPAAASIVDQSGSEPRPAELASNRLGRAASRSRRIRVYPGG